MLWTGLRSIIWASSALYAFASNHKRQSTVQPAPIVAEPSQQWDGIDGPWSTAELEIGSPPQSLRVLVSTAGQETWVVIPRGCAVAAYGSDCANSRGALFTYSSSSSWQNASSIWNNSGIYELDTAIGDDLGLTGNGFYGFDTVSLAWQAGNATIDHTIVAGIATPDYWLGQIGISPRPTNFTVSNDNSSSLSDPQPSFFFLLKSRNHIPSLTYSFNPGSYYRHSAYRNAWMSLIFGGYDASRLGPSSVQIGFTPDAGRELTVGLQGVDKVTGNGSTSILDNPILARLDSSQAYIWLPLASCRLFEQAFGIVWDDSTQAYLVNDTLHDKLITENSSVVFTLADGIQGGKSIKIDIPYGSFDLQLRLPSQSNSSRYFPLKRAAANGTQYVLGRAFLQEVYLIADYERNVFNISQIKWNDTAAQDIRVITPSGTSPIINTEKSGLTSGAIAGIVIGVVAALAIFGAAIWLHRKRHSGDSAGGETQDEKVSESKPHRDDSTGFANDKSGGPGELDAGPKARHEVGSSGVKPGELHADTVRPSEVEGEMFMPVEMDARSRPGELEGEVTRHELPASSH